MNIDATFWVSISFFIFVICLVYLKVPQKINLSLNEKINEISKELSEANRLKGEAKNLLDEYENRLSQAQNKSDEIIKNAKEEADKFIVRETEKFHQQMDIKKKNTEEKIKHMKDDAINAVKNASIKISFDVVDCMLASSIDKKKLDSFYEENLKQAKSILKKIAT